MMTDRAPHTTGPWSLRKDGLPALDNQNHIVECQDGSMVLYFRFRNDADARLIAAAPELLEALRPFANYACATPHVGEPQCHNCIARAAIAKATGLDLAGQAQPNEKDSA